MKRWGLRDASVSHDKKHDTGANATQPLNPQCFIPVVGNRFYSCPNLYFNLIVIIRPGER